MNLADLIKNLDLKIFVGQPDPDRQVDRGYVSDLLSDVMAHSQKDYLWVTMQIHPNIVAVAVLKELAAVILVNGREPAEETIERAAKEQVLILGTSLPAFELVGRLYGIGIKGNG